MRLVQHPESHYYLDAEGGWVRGIAKAENFESSVNALRFCADRAIRPFQIILHFDNAEWDIVLLDRESRRADLQPRPRRSSGRRAQANPAQGTTSEKTCVSQDDGDNAYCKVLIADDSEDDRFLLRRQLRNHRQFQIVAEVRDGEEAKKYLSGQGIFSHRGKYPFPDLIFLDLKMPRTTGYELLEWLQTQSFDHLKVVVLSGSILPEDVARSFELGADAYETKTALAPEQTRFISRIKALLGKKASAGTSDDQEVG